MWITVKYPTSGHERWPSDEQVAYRDALVDGVCFFTTFANRNNDGGVVSDRLKPSRSQRVDQTLMLATTFESSQTR